MSLPVIRALGKSGVPVISTEREICPEGRELGFYSKHSKKNVLLSDAEASPDGFIEDLRVLSSSESERPVIIPVGISSLLAMCERRGEIAEFADAALPSIGSIRIANDKSSLIPFARSIGIPVPETTFRRSGETAESLSERIPYPAVIKLPRGEMLGLDPNERYKIVKTRDEFLLEYAKMEKLDGNILVQQYIRGEGYGVSAVFSKNHEPLEIFCHRRIREYPASGGPSCFCESADLPELALLAVKLLRALDWVGVAMVEFRGNAEDGFYLMEINPRFWGSTALAPNSGCNIPLALYRAACGELAPRFEKFVPNYKVGQRMRFLLQDLLSYPAYRKRAKNKAAFSLSFFGELLNPRISDGVLSASDIASSIQYLKQAIKKTDRIVR